jgi:phosphatidate cytidylyltransferase
MTSRIVVAVLGIALVFASIQVRASNDVLFVALLTAAVTIAVIELSSMLKLYRPYVPVGLLVGIGTPLLAWQCGEAGMIAGLAAALPLTLLFVGISADRSDPMSAIMATLLPVGYIVLAGASIVLVRVGDHGTALIWLMLVGTWISDSAAFFGGKALGRHKLAPRISPNKTIEGLVFGLAFGTFAVWYGGLLTGGDHHQWLTKSEGLLLGLVISSTTVLGDLFESLLKRSADIKDSGSMLGEHGGVLDRVDALLLVGPAVYATAHFVG